MDKILVPDVAKLYAQFASNFYAYYEIGPYEILSPYTEITIKIPDGDGIDFEGLFTADVYLRVEEFNNINSGYGTVDSQLLEIIGSGDEDWYEIDRSGITEVTGNPVHFKNLSLQGSSPPIKISGANIMDRYFQIRATLPNDDKKDIYYGYVVLYYASKLPT